MTMMMMMMMITRGLFTTETRDTIQSEEVFIPITSPPLEGYELV